MVLRMSLCGCKNLHYAGLYHTCATKLKSHSHMTMCSGWGSSPPHYIWLFETTARRNSGYDTWGWCGCGPGVGLMGGKSHHGPRAGRISRGTAAARRAPPQEARCHVDVAVVADATDGRGEVFPRQVHMLAVHPRPCADLHRNKRERARGQISGCWCHWTMIASSTPRRAVETFRRMSAEPHHLHECGIVHTIASARSRSVPTAAV